MDLPTLASVLQLALSANPEERKAGEERLTQYQHAPGHLVGLMQIVVRTDVDIAIRQIASIYFKNLVSRDWEQEDGKPDVFAASDKSMVRDNLLEAIICAPPAIRSQLQECLKAVVNADYPERWPALLPLIDGNLKSRDQQRTYGALVALRVLSRKYEFKDEEERVQLHTVVGTTFPVLLDIFKNLIAMPNPGVEIADLIKLICKIFSSACYLEVPKFLHEEAVFLEWMGCLLALLERPVTLEGQPQDPELRKAHPWWKVKKWALSIVNRLYNRFGDPKMFKGDLKSFALMFHRSQVAGRFLQAYLNLLGTLREGGYLPDRITNLALQYLTTRTSKRSKSLATLLSGGRMEPYQFCPLDGQLYQEGVPFCESCGCARFSGSRAEKYRPPWQKILYEAQPYEDNYTDHTFLASLVTNANVVKRDYWSVVRNSLVVSLQLCTVVMVAVVASSVLLNQARHASTGVASSCEPWRGAQGLESSSSAEVANPQASLEGGCWENNKCRDSCAGSESCIDLREPRGGTSMLLVLDAALLWAGFAVLVWANHMRTNCTRSGPRNDIEMTDECVKPLQQGPRSHLSLRNLFSCFLFFSGICILSPILQTLTRSISSDTISTSTVFLLIIHLVFHDYGYSHAVTTKFTGNVSLMAAIFASVLVASRLESQTAVFALILFCLEFFVFFPAVLHEIKQRSTMLHLSFSLAMVVSTMGLLYRLSGLLAGLFVFTLLFITCLCPYWLVKIQKLKYEITGPWDEAKLMVASK